MKRRTLLQATVATVALMLSVPAMADSMADAKAVVDKYASKVSAWDGPTSGPKGASGKNIVILAADMKNFAKDFLKKFGEGQKENKLD